MSPTPSANQIIDFPPDLSRALEAAAADWEREGNTARLWARDASLWTGADEARWMGWLDAPRAAAADLDDIESFARQVAARGVADVLLLGMGGSSLCPEVFARTFGPQSGFPRLRVLDSTDPAQVARLHARPPVVQREPRRIRAPYAVDDVGHARDLVQRRRQPLHFDVAVAALGRRGCHPVSHGVKTRRHPLITEDLCSSVTLALEDRLEGPGERVKLGFVTFGHVDQRDRQPSAIRFGQ